MQQQTIGILACLAVMNIVGSGFAAENELKREIAGEAIVASEHVVAVPTVVPLPEAAVIEKLIASGAQVTPLFAGSSLLEISYALRSEPATDVEIALLAGVAEQVYSLNLMKAQVTDQGLAVLAQLKI